MRDLRPPSTDRALLALVLLALLAACGEPSRVQSIEHSRTYEPVDGGFAWHATPRERFRFSLPQATPAVGSAGDAVGGLHWTTPPGWEELPTSALRQANFKVGDDGRTECYLTLLAGDGGGLVANVNRWRKQMSLPDATAAEIDALPRAPFFEEEAVFVDLEGNYAGMSGDETGTGYRMVGFVQVGRGTARFLKLVGPAETVDAELEGFFALAASFHQDEPGAHDPHAGLGMPPADDVPAAASGTGMLAWEVPEGWRRGQDRPMREVTLHVGDGDETECYVTVLGGTGGGVEANINRWRDQMGVPGLSTNQIEDLPRIPLLGREAVLVEIPGAYSGMGDADVPDALMLGAVCMLPQASIFVKMVGPREMVEGEREAFLEFCKSMELAR